MLNNTRWIRTNSLLITGKEDSCPDPQTDPCFAVPDRKTHNAKPGMSNPTPDAQARPDQTESDGSSEPSAHTLRKPPGHLKLARSLSKSDSDLLASPHCEDDGGRSESLSNCAAERKEMEQMPSFASEWDEVRADELQIKELRRENTRLPLMRDKPEQTCSKFWIYTESYF